jgi:hypothetical protein
MIYKCISFTSDVVPATAKQNAGDTFFRGVFINLEDEYDMKSIKVNFFPTEPAHTEKFQELVDAGKVPGNTQFGCFHVLLPNFKMRDSNTKVLRDKIYDCMDVHVRLQKNSAYVPGQTPEFIPETDPKRRAEQTVSRLGEWVVGATAVHTDATAEVEAQIPAAPKFDPLTGKPIG